jgi:hypothetical protein
VVLNPDNQKEWHMDRKKVMTEKVIEKINDVISALQEITVENPADKSVIDSRIAILEWMKTGRSGKLIVGAKPDEK